ncbi:MAG: GlsB/YeaQ/YmgE family stress response membrane protein, partial [Rikenellaceae bacterium]|nr:GlsB/YeaQ/YmgE family stress response membrane protein [Rikenellaceae bacterium]
IGSVLGGWLFGLMGLGTTSMWGSLITAIVGAVVLLLIVSLFTRRV